MKLKEAKYLGGIGAILNLVSYAVGGILTIAGYVLILLALNKISKIFNDDEVFKKYLYGIISWIVAVVTVILALGVSFISLIFIPLDYGLTSISSFLRLFFASSDRISWGMSFITKLDTPLPFIYNSLFSQISSL